MEKYKKLLESEVPEDIAMGLYLCNEEGLLEYGNLRTKCRIIFVVDFDFWTIWIFGQEIKIRSIPNKLHEERRFGSGWGYYQEFDFRTK